MLNKSITVFVVDRLVLCLVRSLLGQFLLVPCMFAQSAGLPQGMTVKDNGPRTYRFTVDYNHANTKGEMVYRQRIRGEYTRGLAGGEVEWRNVTQAQAVGPTAPFAAPEKRDFMEGFRGWRRAKLCDQVKKNCWKPQSGALRQPEVMCPAKEWPALWPVRTLWKILVSGVSGAAVGGLAGHPLAHRFKLDTTELKTPWLTIVGTVGDVRYFFLNSEVRPTIYVPFMQQPLRFLNLVLRSEASMNRTMSDVRESVQAVDSTVPVYGIERISQFFADLAGGVGLIGALMGVFAIIALALAAAGIYAVVAYSVTQRTEEIGIRMALGAQPRDIRKLVVGNAMRLLGIGLGLGLPVALALGRVMSSVLSGVVALEPSTFITVTIVLSAVSLLAGYLPARRATKVDPMVALRRE
jgi:hypothetical protein